MAQMNKVYSSLFGSETSKGQLYGGFYTLFGGVLIGLAAIVLLFVAGNQPEGSSAEFSWRKASFVFAAAAGALVFLGVALTLPSKRSMRIVATVGLVLCAAGTAMFAYAYPMHFNVTDTQGDYTEVTVGLYVLGIAIIIAATFTSLVGYYLDRVQAAAAGGPRGTAYSDQFDEYEVPDSVIEKDIEYAMRKYKYAWGDGSAAASGVQINIKDDFEAGTVIGGGKGVARTVQLEAPQVDDATKALRAVRPGQKEKSLPTAEVDAQTNALLAFRKQKFEQKAAKKSSPIGKLGWWQRLLQFLGLRRPAPAVPQLPSQKVGK